MTDQQKLMAAVSALHAVIRTLRAAVNLLRDKSPFVSALLRARIQRLEQTLEELK